MAYENGDNEKGYWVLLGHDHEDDTMNVLCHWHEEPSEQEVNDLKSTASGRYDQFIVAKSSTFHAGNTQ